MLQTRVCQGLRLALETPSASRKDSERRQSAFCRFLFDLKSQSVSWGYSCPLLIYKQRVTCYNSLKIIWYNKEKRPYITLNKIIHLSGLT